MLASGAMEEICSPAVETFIVESEVDEAATMALLECTPEQQEKVMKMGSLVGVAGASAKLMQRIKQVEKQSYKGGGGAALAGGVAAVSVEAPVSGDVEEWIATYALDEKASDALRTAEPEILKAVFARGDLSTARNPSAAMLARIRDARKPGGGSKGGGGAKKNAGGAAWSKSAGGGAWGNGWGDEGEPPTVLRLELSRKSKLSYLSPDAPAVVFQKGQSALSSASYLLSELGIDTSMIQFDHDPDCNMYPEVLEAVKWAGGEENCVCVAKLPSQSKWAVGLAGSWKGRESAAKLAMVVAITAGTPQLYALGQQYPEFMQMCIHNGIVEDPTMSWMGKGMMGGGGMMAMMKGMKGGGGSGGGTKKKAWSNQQADWSGGGGVGGPTPPVYYMTLTQDGPITQGGYPAEATAIAHDKQFQDCFSSSGDILYKLVGEMYDSIEFKHDTEWDQFPEVGAAMTAAGAEENCFCVALLPEMQKWAVGIAGGKKPRESAARLALAVAIAMEHGPGEAADYPELATLCEAAAAAASGAPPAKKRKW